MKRIAELLFEFRMLKSIPRSGYGFLGNGGETVAEHSFITAAIGYVMSRMDAEADAGKLITMCLLHDLAEARTGDLNYVQKIYVTADEKAALADATENLPFRGQILRMVDEFNQGNSREARLARDADQIAFVLDLKTQVDRGDPKAAVWLDHVRERIQTDVGLEMLESIENTDCDDWWMKNFIDRKNKIN